MAEHQVQHAQTGSPAAEFIGEGEHVLAGSAEPVQRRDDVRIGELARKTGIPARMLRYYEEQGLITPERRENGYRDYDESLVERAEKIRCFVDAGVPTRAIEPILNGLENSAGVPQPDTAAELGAMLVRERDRMAERVEHLEKNLTSLTNLISSMGIEKGVSDEEMHTSVH